MPRTEVGYISQSSHPEFDEITVNAFKKINLKGLRVLQLNLKKCWFDMIASGEKQEEYREVKPYWIARLSKQYDVVCFRNGYAKDAPTMIFKITYISITHGYVKWGAPEFETVFCIGLGKRLES